jgi:polar amino acid transport system permease protein
MPSTDLGTDTLGTVPITELPRVPHPHYGRRVTAVLVTLVVAFWVQGLARNQALDWATVGKYLFAPTVLEGLLRTLIITAAAIAMAVVVGSALANMRLSQNRLLSGISWFYVWFFRSIPLLVLLILWYNFSLIYPRLSLGIPFGAEIGSVRTQNLDNPLLAAILAFGLQQAAYTAEVIRAAILSVPGGQREAATALGMTRLRALRRVVLPQAMKVAVPPIANETINLLKATSLVAFISVPDLLYSVQEIYSANFQVVPLLIVASLWYMLVVSLLSVGQFFLERSLSTSRARATITRVKTMEATN